MAKAQAVDTSARRCWPKGRQYYDDTTPKRFKGFVLGYVTPWNRAGYDNAVLFRRKLDAVSPVWFQIKKEKGAEKPTITGNHEVNQTWIAELRQDGSGPLVLPRFIIEAEPEQHVELLQNPRPLLEAVGTAVVGHKLDGMVLEVWSAWQSFNGLQNDMFRQAALAFIRVLAELMRSNGGKEYTGRILSGTIVHVGGNTEVSRMAMTTHHTVERPLFPPGTVRLSAMHVQPQYVPQADPALDELHAVAHVVGPQLPQLLDACRSYHTHSPDGWITTGGFMVAAKRAGLALSRAEYLAMERALTKDTMGRINFLQLEQLVGSIASADAGEGA
ncbi:Chitinase domain-containing protein 1, partial [Tetrabaena socialis]